MEKLSLLSSTLSKVTSIQLPDTPSHQIQDKDKAQSSSSGRGLATEHLIQTYSRNVSFPHLTGRETGWTTALSKRRALWLGVGLRLDTGIARPSAGASGSPGPPKVGNAGGSESRAAREPPHFTPTAGKSGSAGLSFPSGYPGGFRGASFNRSNCLSHS